MYSLTGQQVAWEIKTKQEMGMKSHAVPSWTAFALSVFMYVLKAGAVCGQKVGQGCLRNAQMGGQ